MRDGSFASWSATYSLGSPCLLRTAQVVALQADKKRVDSCPLRSDSTRVSQNKLICVPRTAAIDVFLHLRAWSCTLHLVPIPEKPWARYQALSGHLEQGIRP